MLKTVQRFLLPEEDADEGAVEVSLDDAAEDRERIICRTCPPPVRASRR